MPGLTLSSEFNSRGPAQEHNTTQDGQLLGTSYAATMSNAHMILNTVNPQELQLTLRGRGGEGYLCPFDTGATHSALNKRPQNMNTVGQKCIMGIERGPQHVPLLEETPLQVGPLSVRHPFILLENSPTNFLGRDLLRKLQANLNCPPQGMRLLICLQNLSKSVATLQESPRDLTLSKELQKLPPHI